MAPDTAWAGQRTKMQEGSRKPMVMSHLDPTFKYAKIAHHTLSIGLVQIPTMNAFLSYAHMQELR